ncbi:glycosyl transferase family 1 [Falsiroseomonas bella]|uniref:Glycosyl transferase family 1 n=1 Tax=Falsiroseomonas bella TaxID=2184016 RepID=A0A317FD53_9PROT|nr:GNAT family N-acetyltransferase [Falsiroseomonas bella]PWS37014.1 glycosyl transferase family 1 [Falsiroseomonas bella]
MAPQAEQVATLEPLREEWAALWEAVPDATPFQHPDWLIPWWRHLGVGELLTLALRHAGRLVALMPLWIHAPDRALLPLGIGTTDWLDALVAPGHAEAAMAAAFRVLHARRDRFHRSEWPQLRPASPLLLGQAPPGWRDAVEPAEPCPALMLPDCMEGLRERVSTKTLRDLRVAQRRAAEAGVTCESATPDTLNEFRDALFGLHAARWQQRGEAGVLAPAAVQAMHREAMPALLRAGLLRLVALRLEGRIVAVLHALADPPGRAPRTLYLYLQGFDPACEKFSPGLVLLGAVAEQAIAEGFGMLDFLRGQERYKRFWGAVDRPAFRRVLIPPEDA